MNLNFFNSSVIFSGLYLADFHAAEKSAIPSEKSDLVLKGRIIF